MGLRGFPGVQGGTEMHCQRLYTAMAERDFELRVYRRKPYLTDESHSANYSGISFVDLPSTRLKGLEAVVHSLLCVLHIAFHRPDAVHVHNIGPGMFTPLLRLMGLPVTLTYHSPNYEHSKWGPLARTVLRTSEWLALRWATKVVWVNKFQMEKTAGNALAKSVYIPNGITPVADVPADDTSFLARHGLVPGGYVAAVGRLTPEKGFEHLVKAAQLLNSGVTVAIAGGSDHDSAYKELLESLDTGKRVTLTGVASSGQLAQFYRHARGFVLSSVNEGFPLVMLEAMSHNLPMVVSNLPATHLVELPQECYVEPANPQALAKAIDTMAEEAAKADFKRPVYDLAQFQWSDIASQTARLYFE